MRLAALAGGALWLSLLDTSGGLAAQIDPSAAADSESSLAADSIRCWWKSGRSAVYLGERFSLTVTCRVADTPEIRVAVEESGLDAASLRVAPFDVVAGTRYPDVVGDGERFFQYQYSLRIIADGLFGRVVAIPPLDIRYRIERAAAPGPAIEGPQLVHRLPELTVRIATLASPRSIDIRDAPDGTFGEIEGRRRRGSFALAAAALLFSASLGCVVMAAGGALRGRRRAPPVPAPLSEARVLRCAIRELHAVRRQVQRGGWNADAIGQALAAVRLGLAIGLGQRPPQTVIDGDRPSPDGALVIRSGFMRPRWSIVSASVTAETLAAGAQWSDIGGAGSAAAIPPEDVRNILRALTAARYGRHDEIAPADLERALEDALSVLDRVRARLSWRAQASTAIARAIERRRRWAR